jgi:hypothetical protein
MSSISNIASPGHPAIVVSESPVRAPLAGNIPWTAPNAPAIGSLALGFDAQVRPVPSALVEFAGGLNYGSNPRAGKDI